ncbi:MAG TPA: glycine zipper family protein [Anaeromyxobacteraceae bacterium]|nr:glycine zipper family protein [Anaeromyxobacteraceae bacterium]
MQANEIMSRAWTWIAATVLIMVPVAGQAQGTTAPAPSAPVIYPAKGQTAETQTKDKGECYTWASQQSGYDPVAAANQQAQQGQTGTGSSQSGGAVRGAAKGAAAGAAIGAIAGDPGTGAAAGAAAGGMGGAAKKRKQGKAQQDAAAQQQAATNEKLTAYNKAFGACMEGRGYTVK